ncbi:hypothetical protein DEA8626_00136 [Defluviimonas aquaemixtae]|uniref:Uncharacterized protein n=1 Tax=Albidovulum aquaemixtae TaxID=1542388 RepID=A0A2R8B1V9_9RHOB|nr:hypothetical protein [Defluviimonas aquaemixtae]SPH16626.1 hypothetical protein DEA8626_00136 [Defluviimonas aquaemixtae]
MKLAAAILSQLIRGKSETPDVFDTRLANMGAEKKHRSRTALPMLFHRSARQAA